MADVMGVDAVAESPCLDDRPVTGRAMAWTMVSARLRAQASFRGSFIGDIFSQLLAAVTDFGELYVLLHNAPVIGGMNLMQASVVFGLSTFAFGLADLVFGQLDALDKLIRAGQLDTLLLRPTSLLLQLVTAELQLRRLGRAGFGLAAYLVALTWAGIAWTPAKIALAVIAPLGGFLIFGALFLASGSLLFWVIDGGQAGNVMTYGGRYVSSVPGAALFTPIRAFFTFVVPATLVAYVPAAVLLGVPLPPLLWEPMAGLGVPVGVALWGIVLRIWHSAIGHYTGAGG